MKIYLDNMATTKMDPEACLETVNAMIANYGNPSSQHSLGFQAKSYVSSARSNVASLINADDSEIIFTSGATESNNISIQGVLNFYKENKNHIITTKIEHPCVLDTCRFMKRNGFEVTYIDPDANGMIDPNKIKNAITDKTALVSVHGVNHEIGAIQDLKAIGSVCREKGVFFHTDCAQAFGKIKLDVKEMNIDLMSISGHKIYGPKGIGALYLSKSPNRVQIRPLVYGGNQERGLRSGTLPVPLIQGLGKAAEVAKRDMEKNHKHISSLSSYLINELQSIEEITINCNTEKRYPGCVNFIAKYIEGESLLLALKDIFVSTGSACSSSKLEPSYIIKSIGVKEVFAHSSIRVGISKYNTMEDIEYFVETLKNAIKRLREISPLWEMYKKGVDIENIEWKGHH